MTATRDRRSDLDGADGDVAWAERAVLNNARGWPWWGAVLLAFGLTVAGGILDQQLTDGVGTVFHSAYFVGCVAGICLVRRGSLFGPMVQPPLVLGITVPIIALGFTDAPSVSGLRNQLLIVGTPLINGFPAMALTTAVTVGIGLLRIYVLQKDPDAAARRSQVKERSRAKARAAAKSRAEERARAERRGQRGSQTAGGRSAADRSGSTRSGGRSTAASARDRRGEPRSGSRQGGRPAGEGRREPGTRSTPPDRSTRGSRSTGERATPGDRGKSTPPGRRPSDQPPPRRRRDN